MPKQTEVTKNDSFFSAEPFMMNGQKLMFSMARMQGHAMRAALQMQVEAMSFLKHRYEQDLKLVDDLTGSDGFSDAVNTYSQFLQETVTEYSDETGKIAEIGTRVASDTAKRAREEAEAFSEEIAARNAA